MWFIWMKCVVIEQLRLDGALVKIPVNIRSLKFRIYLNAKILLFENSILKLAVSVV